MARNREPFKRFSVTMPADLCEELNAMVEERSLDNRSMVIADLVKRELLEYKQQKKHQVMAGTITLSYSESYNDCAQKLIAVRREFLDEVISNLQVLLEDGKVLEIWLVQGEVGKLYTILATALKCSKTMLGKLNFAEALLPPVQRNEN
ncbi:MAG: CopG family transcriptional regulator, nickel-responsive regulator [Verrucomicrobiota bacterium]|nr:CopG family transcriptional regulator, nickel-responsive regulator [Verrucomicrobiota bacterium]